MLVVVSPAAVWLPVSGTDRLVEVSAASFWLTKSGADMLLIRPDMVVEVILGVMK